MILQIVFNLLYLYKFLNWYVEISKIMSHRSKVHKAYIRWKYENFNLREADEIHPEDLQAAADYYDELMKKRNVSNT